jgi:hypothetical protein
MNPHSLGSYPIDSGIVRPPLVGGLPTQGSGDLTVPISLDGAVIAKVVLKDYKSKAQRQFGDSSRWSQIQ